MEKGSTQERKSTSFHLGKRSEAKHAALKVRTHNPVSLKHETEKKAGNVRP